MNMRFYKDGTVDYTATFFALVRTGLKVYMDEGGFCYKNKSFKKVYPTNNFFNLVEHIKNFIKFSIEQTIRLLFQNDW